MAIPFLSFAKAIENQNSILESESEIATNWFGNNHVIVSPGKFRAIIFDKHKGNHGNQILNINQREIKAVPKA